jgi:hypothetical protein
MTIKIGQKISSTPQSHFIKYLTDVLRKSPREND